MRLSDEDGNLFYKLWFPLLDYVNEIKCVKPDLHDIKSADTLNPGDVKEVADVLWSEVSIIDDYLEKHDEIQGDERNIVSSWKCCVSGRFMLERILKKGAILISCDDEKVYQVSGIVSAWDEMFGYAKLPMIISATLIPFRDIIIPDGLIQTYRVVIGGNIARSLKETYMSAKKSGQIYRSL